VPQRAAVALVLLYLSREASFLLLSPVLRHESKGDKLSLSW